MYFNVIKILQNAKLALAELQSIPNWQWCLLRPRDVSRPRRGDAANGLLKLKTSTTIEDALCQFINDHALIKTRAS